jgi:hypothetical protein
MSDTKMTLGGLLTDNEEASELLQIYGIEAMEYQDTRQRLQQLVAQIGEEQLLMSLFDLASGFALMAQEIFDLVREAGVGIRGQILLPARETPVAFAAVDSGWAYRKADLLVGDIDQRAGALISRLLALDAFDPKQLVRTVSKTRDTKVGLFLRSWPHPQAECCVRPSAVSRKPLMSINPSATETGAQSPLRLMRSGKRAVN